MLVNRDNLRTAGIGFRTSFQGGLSQASSQWQAIATRVASNTREQEYGWLGMIPNVREWLGPRHIHNMAAHDYAIKNRLFELTIAVRRVDIEDDNLGLYAPMFTEMGRSTGAHYDQLVWSLLRDGWTSKCYDKQNYFDTDHPVLDELGREISVANTDGGAGAPWYLVDDSRVLKPVIVQVRRDFGFAAKDNLDDDNVFNNAEFVYGSDGRGNVGWGFWQFCWGSRQPLDAAHYEVARVAISSMKGDYGRPLGLMPRKLIVPPEHEGAARRLITSETLPGGATNEWKGTAEVVVVPWLA